MKKLLSIILGLIIVAGLIFLLFRLDDVLFIANEINPEKEESNEVTLEEPIVEEKEDDNLEQELEETKEIENNEDNITEESNN